MKHLVKKLVAFALAAMMILSMSVSVMAAPANVYVNFICAGQVTGQVVPAGSNVVAPAVPVCPGFTFCGFDKSLKNVTENTTYTAVYVSNSFGETAIAARKASLPTPAITATTVANPNAVVAPVPVLGAPAVAPTAVAPATTAAPTVTGATAITPEQQAALLAYMQKVAQMQADINKQNAQKAALAATPAVTAPTVVPTAAPAGVPSWVVGLEGVSQQGAITAYNYLKNTKGLDDGSIQANWGAFMHHYAGHGTAGW